MAESSRRKCMSSWGPVCQACLMLYICYLRGLIGQRHWRESKAMWAQTWPQTCQLALSVKLLQCPAHSVSESTGGIQLNRNSYQAFAIAVSWCTPTR